MTNHHPHIITASTIQFNRLEFVDNSDVINISDAKQSSIIHKELKTLHTYIDNDIQSLSCDIHDLGAGHIPDNELPVRPSLHSESNSSTKISSETSSSYHHLIYIVLLLILLNNNTVVN